MNFLFQATLFQSGPKIEAMKKLLLIALFSLLSRSSNGQSFNPQLAAMLEDTFDTYVAMIPNIKGMSVSIYIPGQGLWQRNSGVSYTGKPITSDMQFGIASNSKLFVATAILLLAENNILSLDDSLHTWLPNYPNVDPTITIRQLLNHTSGISDPIFVSPWMDTIMANPTRVFTPLEVLSWLGPPQFVAGSSWGYSNVNYILAGMIAESATGVHISSLIRDNILTPLNMDSTFYDVEEPALGNMAHRWWNNVDFHDTSRVGLNTAGGAAGAIFSTSSEMAQWYNALFSGQILDKNSIDELTTFVATASPTLDYGLGLNRETTQGYTYWGHAGDTWGYRSKMIYDSCLQVVVCGLSNSFPSGMSAVTFLLYRVVKNHVPECCGPIAGKDTVCQGEKAVVFTVPPIANASSYTWSLPSGAIGTSATNIISVDFGLSAVSGNIVVTGVNAFGAGGSSVFSITVNPIPPAPVISQNTNLLTSDAVMGNQWYNAAGIIAGETGQTYTITATDDYSTIVTLSGCSSDTSNVIHATLSGIEQEINPYSIKVYPNPVSNELSIERIGNSDPVYFEILNALGQVVFKGDLVEKTVVQTLAFPSGVYLVKLQTAKTVEFKKVIKE